MYSAVLMLALTAGSESADFGRKGCAASTAYCCGTTTYTVACSAYDCSHRRHRRHACSTACYMSPVCSGYMAPVCSGYMAPSCTGYMMPGCASSMMPGCAGSMMPGCAGSMMTPPTTTEPKMMPKSPSEKLPEPKKKKDESKTFAPATIVVNLPSGARLSVDGASTSSTAERRTLVTPALEVGDSYVYTLRAEFVSNGQTLTETQEVTVRGGQTSTVQFHVASGVASR